MMIQLYFNVFHNIFLVFNSVAHGTIGTYRLGSRHKKADHPVAANRPYHERFLHAVVCVLARDISFLLRLSTSFSLDQLMQFIS